MTPKSRRHARRIRVWAASALLLAGVPLLAQKGRAPQGAVLHLDPEAIRLQMSHSLAELVDVNNQTTMERYLRAFAKSPAREDQDQIVSEMTDFCIERGLRPSPDLAETFLSKGLEAKGRGDWKTYKRMAVYAESFAPNHPAVHLALAEIGRHRVGFLSSGHVFESLLALFYAFQNVETRWMALANLALWLRATAFLLLLFLAVLLLIKYQSLIRHDVKEWFGGKDTGWVQLAGLAVLFLPSLLLLSGYWWIIYWAGLFLLYARWPERFVIIFAVLLFVVSGAFSLGSYRNLYEAHLQPNASNIRCYANRVDVSRDTELIVHANPKDPLDKTYAHILACRYMIHGSYVKAESIFRTLMAEYPGDANMANNLGCLYFFENRYQEAIQQFSNAIRYRPAMAVAYFNRSMAKNKVFDFSGSQQDQGAARKFDANLFKRYKLNQSEDWSPIPTWIDLYTTRQIAAKLSMDSPGSLRSAIGPGTSTFALIFRPAFSFWSVFFVLVFLAAVILKKRAFFARACFKCGHPYCSKCKTSLEFESFCSQCVHLFIKQDGVSPEARLKKNYEVGHYRRTRKVQRIVSALLAPGAAHFLEGSPFTGFLVLLLWSCLWAGVLVQPLLLSFSFAPPVATKPLHSVFFLLGSILALFLWLLFGLSTLFRRFSLQARIGKGG